MPEQPKSPSSKADDLTKTKKKEDVELKEDQLGRVTGGAFDGFLKIDGVKGESTD